MAAGFAAGLAAEGFAAAFEALAFKAGFRTGAAATGFGAAGLLFDVAAGPFGPAFLTSFDDFDDFDNFDPLFIFPLLARAMRCVHRVLSCSMEFMSASPGARPRGVKIVCTLGPASSDEASLGALIEAGLDVARLNFSHGSHAEHAARARMLRRLATDAGRSVALLQDLQGPKVRIGAMAQGARLVAEACFELQRGAGTGDARRAFLDDPLFFEEVQPGDRLLLADGTIELLAERCDGDRLSCRVLSGGVLTSRKGVNLPRGLLRRPALSDADRADLAFGVEIGVDLVAVSYVRSAEDLRSVRRALGEQGVATPLVAKIETAAAIANLEEILEATDAVMLARGDLALETPFERVPMEQKRILLAARRRGRPVITATQLLASMVSEPRPTRAEVNDVANAVLDGTDAVMLSEETAVGAHPARAAETMARIIVATEQDAPDEIRGAEGLPPEIYALGVVAESAAWTARAIGARAIVAWTRGGLGARLASRASRRLPILAPARTREAARLLGTVRAVTPIPALDGSIDPGVVRALLGAGENEDAPLVLLGHDVGPLGRPIPWMRVAHLDEPAAWCRDPAGGGSQR